MATYSHSVAEVRSLVTARWPHYPIDSVGPIGGGLDNMAYEVNRELIVRFSKAPDPDRLEREVRVLAALAGIAPLPVPEPAFTVAELGCMVYVKIPGTSMLDLPQGDRSDHDTSIAVTLGEFLTALHEIPAARMADLVETDLRPLTELRRQAAATYPAVARQIAWAHRLRVEEFLEAPPPDDGGYVPVFSHNDLSIEHVLVDPVMWTVTGIIDWSDAAIVDPAYDFGMLYRDLGPAALGAAIGSYRADTDNVAALRDRAVFYAKCSVFEDLAYGLESGRSKYLEKGLAAMEWLFPVPSSR